MGVQVLQPHRFAAAAGFDPTTVTGLKYWGSADGTLHQDSARTTLATADGDPVGSLADRSGLNNHLLQPTSSKRPVYKPNILNGKPVLRFDATDDVLRQAFTVGAQPNTLFLVAKRRATLSGTNMYMVDAATTNFMVLRGQTGWDIYAGGSVFGHGAVDADPHVFVATFNGASSRIRVDGSTGTGGSPGTLTPDGLAIGSAGAGASIFHDGDIAEVLLYNAAVSLTDMNSIGSYLATKYGLSWTTAS